jgi:hypothetical protein
MKELWVTDLHVEYISPVSTWILLIWNASIFVLLSKYELRSLQNKLENLIVHTVQDVGKIFQKC